ncbi:phasin family protein [Rhodovulum sp. BSW8]|uniref:phasin family protein n=1 Tax=Rhodovulum sp. BSW8 TaxID=2259645 RepID=UPI0014035359|nr:phasin family protein [Rhodovulum sp. BSW8]
MPKTPETPSAAAALEAALRAQAEGWGLMAWVSATMVDHVRRTSSEMAAFARDEARRNADAMQRLAACRTPESLTDWQGDYLGETVAVCRDEAERLARMTAEVCDRTLTRMTGWRD